jgi:hypothetical protein
MVVEEFRDGRPESTAEFSVVDFVRMGELKVTHPVLNSHGVAFF